MFYYFCNLYKVQRYFCKILFYTYNIVKNRVHFLLWYIGSVKQNDSISLEGKIFINKQRILKYTEIVYIFFYKKI